MPQEPGPRASRAGMDNTHRALPAVPEPWADRQTGSVIQAWPVAELTRRWSEIYPISDPLGHPVLLITDDM